MAEYIDRQAAIDSLLGWAAQLTETYGKNDEYVRCLESAAHNIEQIPATDVRPVVLCKDCGHWNKDNQHPSKRSRNSVAMCAWFSRNYGTIETSVGDWCSYGYRREES